jgi:hypothetical protein
MACLGIFGFFGHLVHFFAVWYVFAGVVAQFFGDLVYIFGNLVHAKKAKSLIYKECFKNIALFRKKSVFRVCVCVFVCPHFSLPPPYKKNNFQKKIKNSQNHKKYTKQTYE